MSHFTKISTRMVDQELLRAALQDLGFAIREKTAIRGWRGATTSAELVVDSGSHGYDIGFVHGPGGFVLVADWYGIRNVTQESLVQRLTARYSYHATVEKLERQGFTVAEEAAEPNGTVRLVLRRIG